MERSEEEVLRADLRELQQLKHRIRQRTWTEARAIRLRVLDSRIDAIVQTLRVLRAGIPPTPAGTSIEVLRECPTRAQLRSVEWVTRKIREQRARVLAGGCARS